MNRLRPAWAVEAIVVIVLSSILFRCVSATNYTVGGRTGWDLASDMKSWASATTFYTGDNLVFVYQPTHDVIEVGERGFTWCQISSPIHTHSDGNTVIPLNEPGTRYFVCGKPGHCAMGLKVQVDVLARPAGDVTANPSPAGEIGSSSNDTSSSGGSQGINKRRPPAPHRHSPPPRSPPPPPPPNGGSPPTSDTSVEVNISPPPQQSLACRVDMLVSDLLYNLVLLCIIIINLP